MAFLRNDISLHGQRQGCRREKVERARSIFFLMSLLRPVAMHVEQKFLNLSTSSGSSPPIKSAWTCPPGCVPVSLSLRCANTVTDFGGASLNVHRPIGAARCYYVRKFVTLLKLTPHAWLIKLIERLSRALVAQGRRLENNSELMVISVPGQICV